MMNALILTENQTHFLEENRHDPISGDSFSIGDEIVFCAVCKSAFLKDSWEMIKEKHCDQTTTLENFPVSEELVLKKTKIDSILTYTKPQLKNRIPAIFIDAVIACLATFILTKLFYFVGGLDNVLFVIGIALFIFRDNLLSNQSIGKQIMKLYFIDTHTKEKANWYRVFARNLIWWLINGLLYGVGSRYNFAFTVLSILILNTFYIFYMIFNGESFIDKWLEIELVEEIEHIENASN